MPSPCWLHQATETDGSIREGAWVVELTPLMDLSSWGTGARLVVRRENPHPGAQFSIFDMSEGFATCTMRTNPDLEVSGQGCDGGLWHFQRVEAQRAAP